MIFVEDRQDKFEDFWAKLYQIVWGNFTHILEKPDFQKIEKMLVVSGKKL